MPIAAVPSYLGKDFRDASPALRFGMYLPIWTDRADQEQEVRKRGEAKSPEGREVAALLQSQGMDAAIRTLRQRQSRPLPGLWEKNDFAARKAWNGIVALNQSDRVRMKALIDRESHSFSTTGPDSAKLRLSACAVAPFTTGLGNEHPLENGFAFLNPYGLPYLPGSGVKGVLRQAATELASGQWADQQGWSEEKPYSIQIDRDTTIRLSLLDVLFGRETEPGDKVHVRGALSFWDVIPQIAGDHLLVEIMTPHQSHYYQQKPAAGSTNPHDSGQPNPISFLTVPPGSQFIFHVVCDVAHLKRLTDNKQPGAPDLLAEGETHWKTLLEAAFKHAFTWLGFGAKTAVGYGAMTRTQVTAPSRPIGPPRSPWVDDTLKALCSKPGIKADDALRGKALAEAVKAIDDEKTRQAALADIVARWKAKGWWDSKVSGSAKQAKAIYDDLLRQRAGGAHRWMLC
jgi:CRISPR-associated protein Cmr6